MRVKTLMAVMAVVAVVGGGAVVGLSVAQACGGARASGGGCGCGGKPQARVDRDSFRLPSDVVWQDLSDAIGQSRQTGVPMLVYFSFGSRSAHDVELGTRLFGNEMLSRTLNQNDAAIPVLIPMWAMTAQERALGERLNYGEEGLLALIDHRGQIQRSQSGVLLVTRGVPDAEALLETIRHEVGGRPDARRAGNSS